jgi:hypothetical protein
MNSKNENKISMWLVLIAFLQENTGTTDSLPGFATLFASLSGTTEQAMAIMNSLGVVTKGYAKDKQRVKDLLVLKTAELAGMIRAYAVIEGNVLLEQQMKISKSTLALMRDTVLAAKAQEILDKGNELAELVASYGATEEVLGALSTLIGQYNASLTQPRTGIDNHKRTNEELTATVATGDATIKKMDALMEILRYSNERFYSDYWTRRKVIATGRTRSLQIWIVDDSTGQPIGKAKVMVKSAAGSDLAKNVKVAGVQGGVAINNLASGEYLYEVSFGGYGTETGSFFINDSTMTEVMVRMKRVN